MEAPASTWILVESRSRSRSRSTIASVCCYCVFSSHFVKYNVPFVALYAEYFSDTNTSTYAVPDTYAAANGLAVGDGGARLNVPGGLTQSSSFKPFGVSGSPPPLPPPPHPRDLYSGDSAVCLQGCSGNSCYAVPEMTAVDLAMWTREVDAPPVLEFPRDSLHFVEKLGEGPHGEVRL